MKASAAQVKIVHVLKGALRFDDGTYRALLLGYGQTSSKDLEFEDAKTLIDRLEKNAISAGVWKKRPSGAAEGNRPGYASPKQMRMIRGMWADVSRQDNAADRTKALNTFLSNRFAIARLEWLPEEKVSKVIATLWAMKLQAEKKELAA